MVARVGGGAFGLDVAAGLVDAGVRFLLDQPGVTVFLQGFGRGAGKVALIEILAAAMFRVLVSIGQLEDSEDSKPMRKGRFTQVKIGRSMKKRENMA